VKISIEHVVEKEANAERGRGEAVEAGRQRPMPKKLVPEKDARCSACNASLDGEDLAVTSLGRSWSRLIVVDDEALEEEGQKKCGDDEVKRLETSVKVAVPTSARKSLEA
jgi:hypothetical protein